MVHRLELRTDGEHEGDALLLGHLLVKAYLADGVDDAHALGEDADIDVVALLVKSHGNGVGRSLADLFRQTAHVLAESVDLKVETIGLGSIGDGRSESAQVVVKLLLQVLRGSDLLVQPDMSGRLGSHQLDLCVVLRLGLLRVLDDHPSQNGINLGMTGQWKENSE